MRLTLEPWAPEYDTSLHTQAGMEVGAVALGFDAVDLHCELEVWQPVQTSRVNIQFSRLYFIDGRRRLEAKVFAQWEESGNTHSAPGLLGTYSVGLAELETNGKAQIIEANPSRVLILGSQLEHPGLRIPALGNQLGHLDYEAHGIKDDGNQENQLEQTLQNLMRSHEKKLARDLDLGDDLLILDGTLPLEQAFDGSLGYVKTLHDLRLPPREQRVLFALLQQQRSPIFKIGERRYSWFLRLAQPVEWHQGLSGVVRLEVYSDRGFEWAQKVADWTCQNLPRLAAKSFRDPRAPQQLMPVAFLEAEMGRRMGDIGIVRRRIQAFLQAEFLREREGAQLDSGRALEQASLFETSRGLN